MNNHGQPVYYSVFPPQPVAPQPYYRRRRRRNRHKNKQLKPGKKSLFTKVQWTIILMIFWPFYSSIFNAVYALMGVGGFKFGEWLGTNLKGWLLAMLQ